MATPSPSGSAAGSLVVGLSTVSCVPSSTMPAGVVTCAPWAAAQRSGSTACSPISAFRAPTTNSRMEMVPPCAKKGRTRRSVSTPLTCDVSSVPLGLAVMEP